MKELLAVGALDRNRLPLFLTTWVDKTSQQCMFTPGQLKVWSLPHLKAGSWYLDCGKGFCPEEEEELKKRLDAADLASGIAVGAGKDGAADDEDEDLSHLNARERKRVIAQRNADAEKARKRLEKEAGEKPKRDATKSGRKKGKKPAKSAPESSESAEEDTAVAEVNIHKRDATFAGLSNTKLQQGTGYKLKCASSSSMLPDELIINYSLLSIDQYYAQHNSFPKCWDDILEFMMKVTCLPLHQAILIAIFLLLPSLHYLELGLPSFTSNSLIFLSAQE